MSRRLSDHGAERRQQIVDAAITLFADNGYSATRISDICDAAGVAKGLLYWYFDAKLDVFAEVVLTMRQRLRRAQAAAFTDDADALTRIGQGARASVRFMAEHAGYYALVNVERNDPDVSRTLRQTGDVYFDDVIALIEQAQSEGTVIDVSPRQLAVGVLGAVSSFTNALRAGSLDADVEEIAEFTASWITRSLSR